MTKENQNQMQLSPTPLLVLDNAMRRAPHSLGGRQKINIEMDIKVGKVPEDNEIESMYVSLVEVESDEGDSILENNLHLEIRNIGRKTISFLDSKIKHLNHSGKEVWSDSYGTFDLIKSNEIYEISVPFFTTPDTTEQQLDITIQHKSNLMQACSYCGCSAFQFTESSNC